MRSPPGPTLRVRRRNVETYMAAAGFDTYTKLAARMGVDSATVSRMLTSRRVSARTLGGLLAAFPGKKFDDLFELVKEDEEDAA